MGEIFKAFVILILGVIFLLSFVFGYYYLKRTINYELYYESQIESKIEPLVNKINKLESRMKLLEMDMKKHAKEKE